MPNDHAVPKAVSASVAQGANLVKAMREFVGYSVDDLAVASGLATEEIDRKLSPQHYRIRLPIREAHDEINMACKPC